MRILKYLEIIALVSVEGVDIVANGVCVGASTRNTMGGNKQSLVIGMMAIMSIFPAK